LWACAEPTYDAILRHPFLAGLCDGSLPRPAFVHFVVQDAHYLADFARALSALGARAPAATETAMWSRHAAGAIEVERELHGSLLSAVGVDAATAAAIPVAPTTLAYTSYLLGVTATESYRNGVAAVLPCYWIYREVGRELARKGSPDERYQRWIDAYADDAFDALVEEVIGVVDAWPSHGDEGDLHERFATAARWEWMFWDAAWKGETWPV
jgi:thiaminase/transcriptional activator TenA